MNEKNNNVTYHKPIIIPELLKELVHRQIEINYYTKNTKISEKTKLAQKCYLSSLKLIKSHIVSGLKESECENPLEYAQELLISSGNSTQIHKLNRLYDKISNLSLSIPELSYIKINNSIKNRGETIRLNKFEDKILRLFIPLYNTGIDNSGDLFVSQNVEVLKDENMSGLRNIYDSRYIDNVEYRISNYQLHSKSVTSENIDGKYDIFGSVREQKVVDEVGNLSNRQAICTETDVDGNTNKDLVDDKISESMVLKKTINGYSNTHNLDIVNFELKKKDTEIQIYENDDSCSVPLNVLEKILLSPTQELALVNDILYVLQGFEGQFIKYDISIDQYALLPSVYSPISTRAMVSEICELGVMCRRMNLILKKIDSQLITPYFRGRSTLTRVLVDFSKELLEENLKFVSGLQNDVQETISRLSRLDVGKNPNKELIMSDRPLLTLRKLLQIMNEQKNKKKKIFAILEGLYGLNNTCILSGLYLQLYSVNSGQKAIVNEVFQRCLTVWLREFNMVIREGIASKYNSCSKNSKKEEESIINLDFFICENLVNKREGRLVYLQESLVPVFISIESANIVLKICETRTILGILSSKGDYTLNSKFIIKEITPDILIDSNNSVLYKTLKEIQTFYNNELFDIIMKKDSLLINLSILRDMFLCLRGDFWELVNNTLSEELSKPINKVSIQNLQDLFENVLDSTFKKNKIYNSGNEPNIVDILSINISNHDSVPPDSTGWEAFSIKYEFPTKSLPFVLSSLDITRYERAFKVIWKINTVSYRLNAIWIKIIRYLRCNEINSVFNLRSNQSVCYENMNNGEFSMFEMIPKKLIILRYTSCLIRNIILSIDSIKGIIVFDSINSLWEKFNTSINTKAFNLNDIKLLHNNYLSGIEFGLFISPNLCNCSNDSSDTQIPKLTQDLYLCLDLLLETGLYIYKVSSSMLTNINMSEYYNRPSDDENESNLYNFDDEMELCSKNYRNCINFISKNLDMLITEMQDVAPFSSESDKLGAIQLQLDLFKLLLCEVKQKNPNS
ncbi:tubulin [Cryptosporidium xiaoi]|uniref:Spindle pole body component n=1 Tax=Cryptosporidium xiaoi TaxID=659607 RepID=A0AAV9XWE0_9CRYT